MPTVWSWKLVQSEMSNHGSGCAQHRADYPSDALVYWQLGCDFPFFLEDEVPHPAPYFVAKSHNSLQLFLF